MRFERFFTELRDPLFALYGDDARFAAAWPRLLAAVARTAAERPRELRALDHEREITPGLAAARAGRRLRDLRRSLRGDAGGRAREAAVPARAGRDVPAPDAAAARAARRPTTAATRWSTTARSSRRSGTMDDLRALADDLRAAGMALCVDLVLNHTAAEHPWARRAAGLLPHVRRTGRSPTPTSARCPEVFPDTAPGGFTSEAAEALGLDDVQRLPVGPRLHEPRRVRGHDRGDARAGRGGVDVLRLDAAPFLWKRAGHQLPEPARGPRAAAGLPRGAADRRARGGVQGRGDRRAARPRPLPRHRPPRGQGVRPRLPQRAHGAAAGARWRAGAWR